MARGFSGGKQVIKSANTRNRGRLEMMGGSDRCYFFLMQYDRRSGVLTANNNKVNFVETRAVHFACLKLSNCFNRPRLLVLANFNTCFPPEIPSVIAFIQPVLKRVQRKRAS